MCVSVGKLSSTVEIEAPKQQNLFDLDPLVKPPGSWPTSTARCPTHQFFLTCEGRCDWPDRRSPGGSGRCPCGGAAVPAITLRRVKIVAIYPEEEETTGAGFAGCHVWTTTATGDLLQISESRCTIAEVRGRPLNQRQNQLRESHGSTPPAFSPQLVVFLGARALVEGAGGATVTVRGELGRTRRGP